MKAIVVVDREWNIGKNGKLLIHLPTDLKYYKKQTLNKVIVIGRKTLESFPNQKPLPNRTNIVLTANPNYQNDSAIVCVGLEQLKKQLANFNDKDIWISGGAMLYNLFLDQCEKIYVTKINQVFDADRSFKNLDADPNFQLLSTSKTYYENGVNFNFCIYKNKKINS